MLFYSTKYWPLTWLLVFLFNLFSVSLSLSMFFLDHSSLSISLPCRLALSLTNAFEPKSKTTRFILSFLLLLFYSAAKISCTAICFLLRFGQETLKNLKKFLSWSTEKSFNLLLPKIENFTVNLLFLYSNCLYFFLGFVAFGSVKIQYLSFGLSF